MDFISDVLSMLESASCDFNHFFYRLGNTPLSFASKEDYIKAAGHILPADTENPRQECIETMANWMETKYRPRLEKERSTNDQDRRQRMNMVNPKFVLRQWILEEVIKKTTSEKGIGVKNKKMLDTVLTMSLEPFKDEWGGDKEEENRLCGDVPKAGRGFQCSCSS